MILNPLDDPYFDQPSVDTKKPQRSEKKSIGQGRYKQEKLRFSMLEIPVGSVLVYTKDDTITCKTIDESNKVEYNGKTYTISGLAKELLGYSAQGGQYFLYNGELLTDRRARLGV